MRRARVRKAERTSTGVNTAQRIKSRPREKEFPNTETESKGVAIPAHWIQS